MIKRVFAAMVVLVALSACVTTKYVTSNVTRFNSLPSSFSGQTFAIVAVDKDQEESLAFKRYADLINTKLTGYGMTQYAGAAGPTSADYVVTLKYSVVGPSPDIDYRYQPRVRFGFGYGYYGRRWGGAYGFSYDPFYDDYYPEIRQVYARRVDLNMYRGSTYNSDKKERVFEGRALSEGLNGQLEPVTPYIIEAIFRDFPGVSGKMQTVTVPVLPENQPSPPVRAGSASAY